MRTEKPTVHDTQCFGLKSVTCRTAFGKPGISLLPSSWISTQINILFSGNLEALKWFECLWQCGSSTGCRQHIVNSSWKMIYITNTTTKMVPIRLKLAFMSNERVMAINSVSFKSNKQVTKDLLKRHITLNCKLAKTKAKVFNMWKETVWKSRLLMQNTDQPHKKEEHW